MLACSMQIPFSQHRRQKRHSIANNKWIWRNLCTDLDPAFHSRHLPTTIQFHLLHRWLHKFEHLQIHKRHPLRDNLKKKQKINQVKTICNWEKHKRAQVSYFLLGHYLIKLRLVWASVGHPNLRDRVDHSDLCPKCTIHPRRWWLHCGHRHKRRPPHLCHEVIQWFGVDHRVWPNNIKSF